MEPSSALPADFRGLIDRWPSMGAFGREISGDKARGRIFYRRNRVPERLWPLLMELAPKHGLDGLTLEYLAALYQAGKGQGR